MELRASGDRAVLTSQVGVEEHEVDVNTLALPDDLPTALDEWARVVAAVHRGSPVGTRSAANTVVSHRGRQLAGRLAAATGAPVSYRDPMTGDVSLVTAPGTAGSITAGSTAAGSTAAGSTAAGSTTSEAAAEDEPAESDSQPDLRHSDEPTPWLTGLTVSLVVAVVTFEAVLTLTSAVQETAGWLAVLANTLVTAGLAPSVWLARRVRVWRWVSLGTASGLALGWLCLPFVLFSN